MFSRAIPIGATVVVLALAGCAATNSARSSAADHADIFPPPPPQEGLPAGNLRIVLDVAAIRAHALGPRALALLASMPEWKQFTEGSGLDAARDVDRVVVVGPSLIDARRDAVFIRHSANDAEVERAIVRLTSRETGADHEHRRSLMNSSEPSVKASRMYSGGVDRVFLRGPAHKLVVAPSKYANAYARELANGSFERELDTVIPLEANAANGANGAKAAFTLRANAPARSWSYLPKELSELRVSIVPVNDGGADIYAEGACPDAATSAKIAANLTRRLEPLIAPRPDTTDTTAPASSGTSPSPSPSTHVDVHAEGSRVKVHAALAKSDLEALFDFAMVGMRVQPPKN